jgi:DNA recombination protein RmuC
VVIDSKVSLTDYSAYLAAQTDSEKAGFKKNHIMSVKRHIKTLSSTEYRSLYGNDSLDLIIMFMNVEGAYIIACEDELIKEALKTKIAIVGPTTLIAILQIINRAWSNKKQSEDTGKVIDLATSIFDSAVLLSESFIEFQDLHEKSGLKVEQGKKRAQNLINKTEKMRTMGGLEPKKEVPAKLRSINKDQ